MSSRVLLIFVGLSGAMVVALGAYGAHALKGALESGLLITFQKGLNYQITHTLAIFGVAVSLLHHPQSYWLKFSAAAFCLGIISFSGSLYTIVFVGVNSMGLITPLGGLAFIVGWFSLAWAAYWEFPLLRE